MRGTWIAIATLALAGCSGPATTAADKKAASSTPDARTAGLQVATTLQQKWGITTGQAARTATASAVTLPGVLRLDERHTVQITSLLEGKVMSLGAELGASVRRGQVLATIHAPALAQAKTAFLQAAARAELTTREYERARMLLQQEAIDQKEALRRKTESENANTEFGVAESNLHSFGLDQPAVDALLRRARQPGDGNRHDELADPYLQVTSPIDGRIIERDVITGQHILPERILFTVADLSTLWAVLDAREPDLPFLATGRKVRIRTSVFAGRTWDGRIIQKECCESIQRILLTHTNLIINYHIISKNGNNSYEMETDGNIKILQLLDWLYKDTDENIRMEIKYNKYQQLKELQLSKV